MADKEQPDKDMATSVASSATLDNCSDSDLMRELQSGNGNALTVIFDRYHRLVLVTALRILRDPGEAEDVMQGIFWEIFQKAALFDPTKGNLSNWILQYAYHRSIDRKSYLTLRQFYTSSDLYAATEEELWVTSVTPSQEHAHLVQQSLALVNPQQHEVLELVFFKQMTLREIAEHTRQSIGNVRHHYHRSVQRLRDELAVTSKSKRQAIAGLDGVDPANA